jgi:cell division protein ZapA (FtsZ GTPase activity inhibitor)
MPILKLKIEDIEYDIECKSGEEKLLREAEKIINEKLQIINSSENLTKSKKFLILSLTLASELFMKTTKEDQDNFNKISNKLKNLEKIIEEKYAKTKN